MALIQHLIKFNWNYNLEEIKKQSNGNDQFVPLFTWHATNWPNSNIPAMQSAPFIDPIPRNPFFFQACHVTWKIITKRHTQRVFTFSRKTLLLLFQGNARHVIPSSQWQASDANQRPFGRSLHDTRRSQRSRRRGYHSNSLITGLRSRDSVQQIKRPTVISFQFRFQILMNIQLKQHLR